VFAARHLEIFSLIPGAAANDGKDDLAFLSAGNFDHYTLGCVSCKMVDLSDRY